MSLPTAAEVEADLVRRLADPPSADPLYDALTHAALVDAALAAGGGLLLNPDAARELSPHYATVDQRLAFTAATECPALRYVTDRFYRTVRARPSDRDAPLRVLFLAGGPASGKTQVAAHHHARGTADLILDARLDDLDAAARMIDTALMYGWTPSVLYVHRVFNYAMKDMLDRAARFGRFVPLAPGLPQPDLATLHVRAQRTLVALHNRYADAGKVTFGVLRHGRSPDNVRRVEVADLSPGGGSHYGSPEAIHADQARALDDFRTDEGIPGPVRAAVAGDPAAG